MLSIYEQLEAFQQSVEDFDKRFQSKYSHIETKLSGYSLAYRKFHSQQVDTKDPKDKVVEQQELNELKEPLTRRKSSISIRQIEEKLITEKVLSTVSSQANLTDAVGYKSSTSSQIHVIAEDVDPSPPSLHQSVILNWLSSRFPVLWRHLVTEFAEHIKEQETTDLSYDNIRSIYNYIEDYENVESDPIIRELLEDIAGQYCVSTDHYSQVLRIALQAYTVIDIGHCGKMDDSVKSKYHDIIYSPLPIDEGYLSTMDKNWTVQLLEIIANIQISQEY